MWMALGWMLGAATAASLPGVPLDFEAGEAGAWVLPAELPANFVAAGVQPGWALAAVDGRKMADVETVQRQVAAGPARDVQLHFDTDEGEVIVQVRRNALVQVREVGVLPWVPEFNTPATGWERTRSGAVVLLDDKGIKWSLDPATGATALVTTTQQGNGRAHIPALWWSRADADWVVDGADALVVSDKAGARAALEGAVWLPGFQGQAGDHLVVPAKEGLVVHTVAWPQGTPELPSCIPDIPESCLVAGRHVSAQLLDRDGGREEALRTFGIACQEGVTRACLEGVALDLPRLEDAARACVDQDPNACHEVARDRLSDDDASPDALTVGVLEYACTVDASGSLGERLRRLEDVGQGCMLLAEAFDRLGVLDRALLSLDQACVLGRVEACTAAATRREQAFALRTVRECEDPELPLASSCVQLGLLLQEAPISATRLDDFEAFQRGCELGDDQGCVYLGDYVDRWGIAHPRVATAERDLRETCSRGEQRACIGEAHLLVRHDPDTDAYAQALLLFDGACNSGLPSACIAGAEQRRLGTARKIEAPAPMAMWGAACALDSAPGCEGLGAKLARSKQTWPDAFTAWTKACDTGQASACTELGRFVLNKHDPAWEGEQPSEAYLERGCANGDVEGCYWLAERDMPKKGDPSEPVYLLLEQSCEGDYGPGCAELGRIHLQRKQSFDEEIAARFLEEACTNGHFESCKVLGTMYVRGKGVERDRLRARELLQKFAINAQRKHFRVGARLGFPSIAGAEGEVVLPIPAGPAIAPSGSFSYLPTLGGAMVQLKGGTYPDDPPDLSYADLGLRIYANNKARGLYGMGGVHQLVASGGALQQDLIRQGVSARIGIYNERKATYTRVEMGLGQYGLVDIADFDEDESGQFPLLLTTVAFSMGFALL